MRESLKDFAVEEPLGNIEDDVLEGIASFKQLLIDNYYTEEDARSTMGLSK
jgi:hypothetical protein